MKLLLSPLLILLSFNCFSQCLVPAQYGSIDFTAEQYTVKQFTDPITSSPNVSYLKDVDGDHKPDATTSNPNFKDVKYPGKTKDENCNSAGYDCSSPTVIYYNVYYPDKQLSTGKFTGGACKFPAIILFHGGGFADCQSGGDAGSNLGLIAQEFAKRGYVAFTVQYRTGRYVDPNLYFLTAQQALAEYRSFQDARGAVRSIIWHQMQRNTYFLNDPYQIDINKIFLGGNSAGSIIALHTAYYNYDQIASVFPTPTGQPTIKQALGPVNADYYYGDTTIDYQSKIKGVLNMWGQMSFPKKYNNVNTPFSTFWSDYGNTVIPPMIAFHGNQDATLPIGKSALRFAPYSTITPPGGISTDYRDYNTEPYCLLPSVTGPYKLDPTANTVDLYGQGSKGIYDIFKTLGVSDETYIDCDMVHGLDSPEDVIKNGGVYRSNFGTTAMSADVTDVYIVKRATTFFQAVLTGIDHSLPLDLFYDWENDRIKSNLNITPDPNSTADCPLGNCNQPCTTPPPDFSGDNDQ